MDEPKVALQQIISSLHSVHGILENIFDRVSDGKANRICERFYLDPNDGLKFLALEAKNIHQLATEIESNLSGRLEMQRKHTSRMESKVSSLLKENQEIRNMLKVAITEKEAVENSIHTLKGDKEQGRSSILQIAEKGLHKVGFGFIMEVISAEPASQEPSTSGSTVASNRTENEHEHISLASIVENTMKTLHCEINDLRQAFDESRSDSYHFQLLATERAQKIQKYESHIKELEERESFLVHRVEDLALETKAVGQEATRWREACQLEVEAGRSAIKELNQEFTLLKEELGRVKTDLEAANSKVQLKEKLAASAMAAQAAADACLKLADRRSAGLQQRIEELTRQIEQEDAHGRQEIGTAWVAHSPICSLQL
ncbi:uncharacterized protein At3g49055 [Sorghum bicolor]|uniref:uncharacterized protein At3g49055 n=1 Tax=Sorghum bicolor TaxID=4558 RepID=UPI000B425730|nr:uncharacterized protein At3g49055 [Sorghum bicolor]|eukprot:XP_002444586.2 uncharacterized protein At3g49055 [Sorghum bicolor]